MNNYRPDELAREFARISITADNLVINEPEFMKEEIEL